MNKAVRFGEKKKEAVFPPSAGRPRDPDSPPTFTVSTEAYLANSSGRGTSSMCSLWMLHVSLVVHTIFVSGYY